MFESISESFQNLFRKLAGKARISEKNIEDGIRDVRLALLQADVNFKVVKDFIDKVSQKSVGLQVIKGVEPSQQFIKIIHDEFVDLMGPGDPSISFASGSPTIIMMVGLQGCGKTTTCAKLAKFLEKKARKPLLVAADIVRPAAIEQLLFLAKQCNIAAFSQQNETVINICKKSLNYATEKNLDTLIIDTQGRLHINEQLMNELRDLKRTIVPQQIYLVLDSMTGQDAVTSAKAFNDQLGINAVILTKLDGDAKGGCALSVKAVTGKPIKFVGVGEKIDNFEEFYPDRMASRILGMGDIVTLVEKAQEVVDEEKAKKMQEKLLKAEVTYEDLHEQMQYMKRLGSLRDIVKLIPGAGSLMKDVDIDDKEMVRAEAIILSMTKKERSNPELLANQSRRQRIARGAGVSLHEVSAFIKQFEKTRQILKDFKKGKGDIGKMLKDLGGHT